MTPEAFDKKLSDAGWLWHGLKMKRSPSVFERWRHETALFRLTVTWLEAYGHWTVTLYIFGKSHVFMGSGPAQSPEKGYQSCKKALKRHRAETTKVESLLL